MSTDENADLAADSWGLHRSWLDARNAVQHVPSQTLDRLRELIGAPPAELEERAPIVTRPGRDLGLGAVDVLCEDGQSRRVDGTLPADFPLGYHEIRDDTGRSRRVIVSPGRCWLPGQWRAWGWTVQLYAARSHRSWGIGDLADLRLLREWSEEVGAGFMLVNPLHAVGPTSPQETSPYLPTTRRFRNPIYLRVDEVPGLDPQAQPSYAERGRLLNDAPLIDRDAIWQLKGAALWEVFTAHDPHSATRSEFSQWRRRQGDALQEFAVWCALAAEHGSDWRQWDEDLRNPANAAVASYAEDHARQVDFHAWLQWLLDGQLREATGSLQVLQDLPIGVDGGGADAWVWQEILAPGVTVGAPPDAFNSIGQDWGSPPLVPWRLRLAGYQPFIDSIRATMATAGGLRIDHVMGLFRLWWVPPGDDPRQGAYVRYPSADLLDIVALESHRAEALVVGEDLGTVEPGVREALADHNIMSYRLLWFEDDDPADWPRLAMAAVTTHDLPTVAGLWTGADLEDQRTHSAESEAMLLEGRASLLAHLTGAQELPQDSTVEEAVTAAHARLAAAPSILVSATLDDALAVEHRPNIPGSGDRPNWCLPLPVHVESLASHPLAVSLARLLDQSVREPAERCVGKTVHDRDREVQPVDRDDGA